MMARPIGIGSATPATIITNVDLEAVIETSDEWIQSRTGIAQRHVLTKGETLRSIGVQAAKNALEMANCKAEDIDIVICATSSADDMFGDAPSIAAELGCTIETMAFDIAAACSGFLFATVTAGKFLSAPTGETKKILVIGADALTRWVDWDDRNACILFGDGAGAMVLERCKEGEGPGILGYSAHSNGGGYNDLCCG
jgi:3-oxoacyl-[acyl-carrier-protein] synthase-3